MARIVTPRRATGWWAGRSAREKQLLLGMAALLLIVLVWLLIIRPIGDARTAAEARLTAAVTDLGKARGDIEALKQASAVPGITTPVPLPLDGFLMQAGAEAGLTNLQVTGSGADRATASIASVRPQAFFGWIALLETRGVVVESLSARANADQTILVEAAMRARSR